eukprot:CAMPEP_0117467212 /NCGR_PEP_ID=MMETSP0784-20121206/5538_1 /TAXON_ID=39447 /ORGANISM="" /LENGTH=895 /DNA_ID=CAMNT_0005261171 /DNA_START=95 /DNA_END=2782 /DNA_ORIENTATION=+
MAMKHTAVAPTPSDTWPSDTRPAVLEGVRNDSRLQKLIKVAGPMAFAAFGFWIQSVGLHYATYSYVHRYLQMKSEVPSATWSKYNTTYEKLKDPFEDWLGPPVAIKLAWLDFVAALFPMAFVSLASVDIFRGLLKKGVPMYTLQTWTKVMVCCGFLFIIKGSLGAMTTVPDSSGWEICVARLKPEGLEWMKGTHTLWEMLSLDVQWNSRWHHPLRYCSDMMYSGHTFVVTLFALGCYEMLRIVVTLNFGKNAAVLKAVGLTVLCFVAIGEQLIEIYCVMRSRFHYSMDVFMALIVTFLFFTNAAVVVFAKQWERRGFYFFTNWIYKFLKWPACFKEPTKTIKISEPAWKTREVWATRGDIVLPVCCVPFCCMAGRTHLYSDNGLKDMIASSDNSPDTKWLEDQLLMNEGVSMDDLKKLLHGQVTSNDVENDGGRPQIAQCRHEAAKQFVHKLRRATWRRYQSRERRSQGKSEFYKWIFPMLFAMFGFYCQSIGLHYATYSYVQRTLEIERSMPNATWARDGLLFNKLQDPVEDWMGPPVTIKLGWLDAVAAFFPMCFVTLVFVDAAKTVHIWTKVMVCAGFLFIIKGSLGAMTTVPDASGWEVCKGRLKEEGLDWMERTHSFWDMATIDFQWVFGHHHALRYCADMMYSGHTFVVTLFALGCYELLRVAKPFDKYANGLLMKALSLSALSVISVGEQLLEIYCVESSRFHYTMDVFMALIITFLFFTNGAVAVFAKQWEISGFEFIFEWFGFIGSQDDLGDACTCLDCFNRKLVQNSNSTRGIRKAAFGVLRTVDLRTILPRVDGLETDDHDWKQREVWVTKGDIFLPPCCIPFCCLAGREHVYYDTGLTEVMNACNLTPDHIAGLRCELNMDEGLTLTEFKNIVMGKGTPKRGV